MKYKGEVHLGTTRYITLVTSFFFLECFKLQKKFHCFPGVQKSCHYFQPSLNNKNIIPATRRVCTHKFTELK